jgi:hypothetical protein
MAIYFYRLYLEQFNLGHKNYLTNFEYSKRCYQRAESLLAICDCLGFTHYDWEDYQAYLSEQE